MIRSFGHCKSLCIRQRSHLIFARFFSYASISSFFTLSRHINTQLLCNPSLKSNLTLHCCYWSVKACLCGELLDAEERGGAEIRYPSSLGPGQPDRRSPGASLPEAQVSRSLMSSPQAYTLLQTSLISPLWNDRAWSVQNSNHKLCNVNMFWSTFLVQRQMEELLFIRVFR